MIDFIRRIYRAIRAKITEWRWRFVMWQIRRAQERLMRDIGRSVLPAMKEWIETISAVSESVSATAELRATRPYPRKRNRNL